MNDKQLNRIIRESINKVLMESKRGNAMALKEGEKMKRAWNKAKSFGKKALDKWNDSNNPVYYDAPNNFDADEEDWREWEERKNRARSKRNMR